LPHTIPTTVETLVIRSNIEPKAKSYVCCPRCFQLYNREHYPASCNYTEFPGGPECQAHLRQPNGKPIREYAMQEFKDWLARLYARPGLEELLDRDVLGSSTPERMSDIWDAPVMREFKCNGRTFVRDKGTDGRLVFSINMDGFNPYGNKQSGKHVSISAIYMTCLNLPHNIRNRMENVLLVGVIPGPQEPSVLQINNLLEPLVDSLLELWDVGLYLRRTPRYSAGRRVFVAMIPLVADLIASKKMAGFGSARSRHFCSYCFTTLGDIPNLDFHSWKRRTKEEHIKKAEEWKAAKTKAEQDDIFDGYGLRWSQLLRLPYWDPCLYVVIDSMHCFYLGLFHRHAVKIWGMDAGMEDGDGATYRKLIEQLLEDANLPQEVSVPIPEFPAEMPSITPEVSMLTEIVSLSNQAARETGTDAVQNRLFGEARIEASAAPKARKGAKTCVLGKKTIPKLREDMERISLPSWVSRGPAYPGQAKGGKLHADQWRSFFTINLPMTLVRLWGTGPPESRQAKILENFLYLVSAVKVASQRTISKEDIILYEKHMHRYLTTLWDLYPGIELAPYQHIALHFGDFLRRFGPTHGWRCFAFERYNYLLQQTLTN
ncbi:hypothetical protein AGABI2DRAFT_57528, partial [Agaricus bisporus var. bisporus H97]|uniref:hypothetical protein n=1 Tax=Agaricus bisporus var. bisporus (strain H97 / ATCC MYA-4626 / FGSC 10389) TaxID=936046 RepID=UPI00029F586A